MIWGLVIGVALGAIVMLIAIAIWACQSDIPSYADGYENGKQEAADEAAVIIRGLVKKQQVHEQAFKARKAIVQAVIDTYKEANPE